MRVQVEVTTKYRYVAVIEASTEDLAVKEAMLDAILADTSDFDGQEAKWQVVDDTMVVAPDKVKAARVQTIKHRVEERRQISDLLEDTLYCDVKAR